ncbi:la-related protein 4B-like isoform X2 [Orbicella faveolata]|uniref:la-related protein 4B-like isoform X2 n=1 Tax=Orbicella faveolata TaxID=48498 RepID=UPI0009E34F35|nr:la-related protein 4B-like isoform X2 [Orbicella faveolata]
MSSATTENSAKIVVTTSSEPDVVVPSAFKGSLNPNAAAFDCLSHMTLSEDGVGSPMTPPVTSPDQRQQSTSSNDLDNMQYSPNATVNGYEPYSSPVTPEVIAIPPELSPDKLPVEDLKVLLRHQLEFYFSRENLSSDTYLVSQMDGDQYVPIWTVANFNQDARSRIFCVKQRPLSIYVKKLTSNLDLVKDVMRESPNLQVDESGEKVRPNIKRCIVVLREIPESTPIEDVKALFSGENCPSWTHCEFAHNNYWYVQFDSEDNAQKAYRYLREEVKTFRGKPIMARIKAKPLHQSNFGPKNGLRSQQVTKQQPTYNQQHFQFPPVNTVFSGQQALPYYPSPNMLATWPPAHHIYQEPSMPSGYPNGFSPGALTPLSPGNAGHNSFHGNSRPRFQNKQVHHREQQTERVDRDGQRGRPQNAASSGSSNGASVNSVNNRVSGFSRTRDARDGDEYTRRTGRNRRRRGSSEDRQREGKASPLRHSKDDSDTIDLAPSHFPPLPTSPLPLFEPSLPTEKTAVSVVPASDEVTTEATPNETTTVPDVENAKIPETKMNAAVTEGVQSLVLSYAQVTQKTASKHTASTTNSSNKTLTEPK